ncbi:unnamed protein product [Kuraishia capsulata CBS 1993]|uniref:Xylanolytic transcriptional activator regulatory domain-containing protein n=1 Tax=Kuraishia capsulata CBS 1993 TaxID=1382522 RepID=W6MQ36_9ASCO|nr:uncharacterized protein KUCA_T00004766001 [Kuraishia capsulata CBS 1993]CDK28781.1 unnamed protein product [Kuraishia capsulata CBS 1993]
MKHVEDNALISEVDRSFCRFESSFFLEKCLQLLPSDLVSCRNSLEYLQTLGLLILYENQSGNDVALQQYMGMYLTMMALDGLHSELRWPKDIDKREVQTRRRLYWVLYRLEVHSAYVMGHLIRMHGSQSSVLYPQPVDEEEPDYTGGLSSGTWLVGWNFITDCYRILESCFQVFNPRSETGGLFSKDANHSIDVNLDLQTLQRISTETHKALPFVFKEASADISDTLTIRNGFQAANIACTMLLMRLVCLSMESADTVAHSLDVVHELIKSTSLIPSAYFRAVGTPMFQELSGFGYILGRFVANPLLEKEFLHVKVALHSLSDLLEKLNDFNDSLKISQFKSYLEKFDSVVS